MKTRRTLQLRQTRAGGFFDVALLLQVLIGIVNTGGSALQNVILTRLPTRICILVLYYAK